MNDSTTNEIKKVQSINENGETVEVLYQKMGDRWFAFSLIDDEVFVGSLTLEEIVGKHPHTPVGNS